MTANRELRITDVFDFHEFHISSDGRSAMRFNVRGSGLGSCQSFTGWGDGSMEGSLWSAYETKPKRLLSEPLPSPRLHTHYAEDYPQTTLWRSFTEPSFTSFRMRRGGSALWLKDIPGLTAGPESGDLIAPPGFEDNPGFLWVSTDALQATAIGITRHLVDGNTIHLLGFSRCGCSEKGSDPLYDTIKMGDKIALLPTSLSNLAHRRPFSEGYITKTIYPDEVDRGVLFRVRDGFFSPMLDPIRAARTPENHPRLMKRTFGMVTEWLRGLAYLDPTISARTLWFPSLPANWAPFLVPESTDILL